MASYVQVRGHQLVEGDGTPFTFAGANCYYLVQRLECKSTSHEVLEVLDAAQKLGLTVLRTWAFNDGDGWNALQPQPGVYAENMLVALDRLLVECSRRGLRLLPTLTNYWKEYGGMAQYAKWCSGSDAACSEDFYSDEAAQKLYRSFLSTIVNRKNTLTGQQYKDDPTIIAWDIANEPRCCKDLSAEKIAAWVDSTAKYVKSLDSNHLVTFGSEGFFGPSSPEHLPCNPYDAAHEGADFLREFQSPALDFACIHMWHNQWMPDATPASRVEAGRKWIAAHEQLCREVLHKPLVVEEFGCKAGADERPPFYKMVYGSVEASIAASGSLAGSCMWMLAARSYPDYDGYTLHLPLEPSDGAAAAAAAADDLDTIAEVLRHAQLLRASAVQ